MIYQPKRQSAAVMALMVFFFSVVPAKRAEAVVPLVGLAVAAIGQGGAIVTADLLASGVTALIGGSIMALAITPSTADAPVRVPLLSDQATIDSVMPPPAAAATAAPIQKEGVSCRVGSFTKVGATYDEACSTAFSANNAYANEQAGGGTCPRVGYSTCETYGGYSAGQITVNWTMYCMSTSCANGVQYGEVFSSGSSASSVYTTASGVINTCGAGYVMSGDSCVLANARVAQPDNKVDIPVSTGSGGFSAPSASQEADSMPSYASVSGGKVYAQGKNSSGQPVMIEYAKNADGSKTYITHYTQSEDATQTTVKTQSVTVDTATGAVTGAVTGTAVGSISPGTAAGEIPTVSTGTAVTSGTQVNALVFPTDYARSGEAAQAANTVKTSVDQLKDKMTNSEMVNDPTVPDWADNWGNTFNPLKAWSMPGHTSACPVSGFEWNGVTYTMSSHCQLILDHWSGLQTASVVVWTITALFILLGS